ncbi:MAG TPA: helix-hairpin-helix domain-containing protein [Lacibacter sp.]|nr:helix-hairpin-helix domain-containing protein [Lacibacter sp.]
MLVAAAPKTTVHNSSLSHIFHRMADCYRYLGKEERFRAIAYENAAKLLHNMKEDIEGHAASIKELDELKGIGESIAEKIIEYLHTGRIQTYEKLKKQVPFELLELMDITGFGPATLKTLHDQLNIQTKKDLEEAFNSGRLQAVKGFGEKKIENMRQALKLSKTTNRLPLAIAEKIANGLLSRISGLPGVKRAALAGSLRRKKETIGDIDIIILAAPQHRKNIVSLFTSLPQVSKILAKGTTKASIILKEPEIQVDVRLVSDFELGAAMLYFTGSKEHIIKLRTLARNKGYKINEYGIFEIDTNKRVAGASEEEMYAFLKLNYIPPERRLDKGEIEEAMLE